MRNSIYKTEKSQRNRKRLRTRPIADLWPLCTNFSHVCVCTHTHVQIYSTHTGMYAPLCTQHKSWFYPAIEIDSHFPTPPWLKAPSRPALQHGLSSAAPRFFQISAEILFSVSLQNHVSMLFYFRTIHFSAELFLCLTQQMLTSQNQSLFFFIPVSQLATKSAVFMVSAQ